MTSRPDGAAPLSAFLEEARRPHFPSTVLRCARGERRWEIGTSAVA